MVLRRASELLRALGSVEELGVEFLALLLDFGEVALDELRAFFRSVEFLAAHFQLLADFVRRGTVGQSCGRQQEEAGKRKHADAGGLARSSHVVASRPEDLQNWFSIPS